MSKFMMVALGAVLLALAGFVIYLATVDLPPPTRTIEQPIPAERFAE